MKSVCVTAVLAGIAAAQKVVIAAPQPSSTLSPGEHFSVQVDKPDTLTSSRDVSVAIGLLPSCAERMPSGTCDGIDPTQGLGVVLFAGPYAPQAVPGRATRVQNYTVSVPTNFPPGAAFLSVPHFVLVGELSSPSLDDSSEVIFIR